MKLGIAGAGNIVLDLLSFVQDIPGIRLEAICSKPEHEDKLLALQKKHGISRIYHSYSGMLADDGVDTVYIGLPNHLHYTYAKEALLNGKHVICEKPFTSNLEEFLELEQLALRSGLILLEAISNQYLGSYLLMKEYLPKLGTVKIVECNYSQYSSRYDAFRAGEVLPAFNPGMSGGALMDINIYNIHFVVGCFGSPKKVQYSANMDRGIDTSGVLLLDYGEFKCVCIGAKDSTARNAVNIQGTDGYIHLSGSANSVDGFEYAANRQQPVKVSRKNHEHRMYDEFMAFEAMIQGNDRASANRMLEHSRRVMQVVEQAKLSAGLVFGSDQHK
ncbi:NAD(P)-dependent oxidoreductase [Paenibacillus sp. FSL R7-0273]|uniref:Gfo/Idh/MocA family protein n=1 Tax=Paenibacillus sp. FSL R7-0273 TaxID=1536772 RepID=UPI0004F7FA35|nr:Gfo/Idh/MocA family oxidoreductase [Paenibacillus sp. FSL R7-0273]AIQ47217.1 NAD(P)-dependent oxidoreductase [Paenibacillus sp. FSL R7-0273]OMF91537.1 NAD(P)-dependent oxidoreductase [Paenibacillus sp. FSL R7-0273]